MRFDGISLRWLHRAYAAALGYPWLSCALCRRGFGLHEWRAASSMPNTIFGGWPICPRCTRAGRGGE